MSVFFNMEPTIKPPPPPEDLKFVDLINPINEIANAVAQSCAQSSGITQGNIPYDMTRIKNRRNRVLKDGFGQSFSGEIYLTDHIFHAVQYKPKNANINFFNIKEIDNEIKNSIIILSNNNVMVDENLNRYIELYLSSPTSVFVIWDFDNHHWLSLSSMLATACDLYIPTHCDNLEVLSRFNNVMAGPISAGVIQWNKEFLKDNKDIITNTERSNDPLGTHIEYRQFPLRQKNLQILNKTLPNVKLVNGDYHSREMLDRFTEWCSHKAHWIVPVLNDAPIRLFDSLLTGGIPIVPRSIKYHKDVIDLWDHILFYDYEDIQNPLPITEKANNLFDERGIQGVLDRHAKVLYNYHIDNRVEAILKAVNDEYNVPRLVQTGKP